MENLNDALNNPTHENLALRLRDGDDLLSRMEAAELIGLLSNDFGALQKVLVGETGLSAIQEAIRLRALDPLPGNKTDFIPVTFKEVNSAIFEIYNYADRDPERAQGIRLNLHTRVLQAIGSGLCEDPVRCAALAASTDDINLKWE